jgi:archaellum biogenesis ATPase FlaH
MTKLKLSKEHLVELKASGLSDNTIEAAKLYTETDGSVICELLNYSNPNSVNGSYALIIPFGYDGFCRLKLLNPRIRKGTTDKIIKYESPLGSIQHPYFPPKTFDEILKHDCDKEIFIVEGEKKALKLWQELEDNDIDAFVIGLTGVYGWKEKQQEKLVLWLEQIHWTNRIVFLCFDNDVHWNQNVSDARKRLGKVLRNHGADVRTIDIPITDPTQKYGVDDYIVKFGINAFFDCLAKAKPVDTNGIINLEIVCATDVQIVPVEWLWHLYVPKGEITLIDGNPGLGKSQMIADLASRVSRGYAMPPIEMGTPVVKGQNVMLLCAEDTIEKTVKPRLQVCQANMNKVFFMKSHGKPLSFPKDIERFEQECFELDIALVVIDPIMSYIGRDIDTHSDQSAREVLNRLKEFAEHTDISIICLRHLNKRQGDAAIFRGGGSIAFTAASRCNLIVGKHPTDDDVNVLACIKSNLERKPKSLSYAIESVDTKYGPIGKITWLEEVAFSADDISDIDKTKQKVNKIEKATLQISETLKKMGPMLSVELQSEVCRLSGISPTSYQHARKKCNIMRARNPKERGSGQWYSKLPGQSFEWEVKKKEGNKE